MNLNLDRQLYMLDIKDIKTYNIYAGFMTISDKKFEPIFLQYMRR